MIIIGVTGTLGAGKGTIVEFLKMAGFKYFSVRAFLTAEVEKHGLPVNRDALVQVGNELRAKHSPSYIAEQLYEQAAVSGENCVIESLRTLGEVNALRQKGNFYLLAVDAYPALRYMRAQIRKSKTDSITPEEFRANEAREMHSADPTKQNLCACIRAADYKLINNGTPEELRQKLNLILSKILVSRNKC